VAALIEDHALVGNMHSAALISRDGAVPLSQSALNLEEHAGHHCRRPGTDKIAGGSPARPG